ncbi:MAG TPA: signal peptidase I [Beutenbergiaceae bacterium]|nr:signal peptidase I [Beutenbergiaceae bacterium]
MEGTSHGGRGGDGDGGDDGAVTPADATSGGAAQGRSRRRDQGKRGPVAGFLRETAIVVAIALVLSFLIKTFFAQAFYIPSVSMQDTLDVGDRLVVNKLVPSVSDIERGDVVVFVDPGGWLRDTPAPEPSTVQQILTFLGILPEHANEHVIKRVIGLPGDHVECCDDQGRVMVNGVAIDESHYLAAGVAPSEDEFDVQVPAEHLWVMGDNRPRSADSRYHGGAAGGGFVPEGHVTGRAFALVWPVDRFSILSNDDDVFAHVPDPT